MQIEELEAQQIQEASPFQETIELLEQRARHFNHRYMSAENVLVTATPSYSVRSLSELLPELRQYSIDQTPVHPALSDIYLGKDYTVGKETGRQPQMRFIIAPVSQGEDSINQEDVTFQPSFKWISNAIVDSTFLSTDKIEPKKNQRGKVPAEWKNITELMVYNIDQNIYEKSAMQTIEECLKNRFQKFPWIKYKRAKEIYFKGKPSIVLKFGDQSSASFAYFNLSAPANKEFFGQNHELYRVTENRLKERFASDVTLVFRRLPNMMTKESFLNIFKKGNTPTWVEELIEIVGWKYTICKANYLEDAFALVSAFQNKAIKDAKVNYHPKSSKLWRASENREAMDL